ncbi:MAG: hypothetical protein ABH856_01970 [Patescibacteria group bacterium]|nr:hypothetical protein [Patescibacteria group bacterium]
MTSSLKSAIVDVMGEDGVSFVEDGQPPKVGFREMVETLVTPRNVVGNFLYLFRLLGINGGNGDERKPAEQVGGTETVIVPGYASRNMSLLPLEERLRERGIESRTLRAYEDLRLRQPLPTLEAADHVQEIIEQSRAEIVNFVCHSMGGLTVLIACSRLSGETREKVGRIVTLGTPWQGAPLARTLSFVKRGDMALKDLSPGSDILKTEIPKITQEVRGKTVAVISVADKLVPLQSGILEGALLNLVLRRDRSVIHADFLHDKRVAEMVAAILNDYSTAVN